MATPRLGQRLQKRLEIRRRIALQGDCLSRTRMNELQAGRMKRDSSNSAFGGFLSAVLPVANDWMTECRKLHPNLVLQSGQQHDPHQRSPAQRAFHGIAEFSPCCLAILVCAYLLMHSFFSEI